MFFQLAFKALKQRKSVGRAAGESRKYLVVVEPANLACACFGDYRAKSYLAIASERYLGAAPCRKYGGTVKFWHLSNAR